LPAGTLDTSFGTGGLVTVDINAPGTNAPAGQADTANAVAVTADGKIVVAGTGGTAEGDFAFVRLSADGKTVELNKSFQVGTLPASASQANGVAVQSSANQSAIVLAGTSLIGGDTDFTILRVDPTSGNEINRTSRTIGTNDVGRAVAVFGPGPDVDKIVVVGTAANATNDIGVVLFKADGTGVDTTFNPANGFKSFDIAGNDDGRAVAIAPDGTIVAAGDSSTPQDVVVLKIT